MSTPDDIFKQKGIWEWWLQNNGNGTNVFNGANEKGIDYSAAFGTPIGVIAGGTVQTVEHKTGTGINDIVQIVDSFGHDWLYQHITSSVQVGQTLNVGDIVGTENGWVNGISGLVDQYTTGPHIENRYANAYKPGVDSWLQSWIDPKNMFLNTATSQSNTNPSTTTSTGSGNPAADALGLSGVNDFFVNASNSVNTFDWKNVSIRTALIVLGCVALLGGVWLFVSQ